MATQPSDFSISSALMKPRLPILGAVKIGGKRPVKEGQKAPPPMKYDHFVVTTLERGEDGNLIKDRAVHARVGEKPTELDVWLPFENIEENFYAQMVQYGGQTRTYQCNGERGTNLSTGQQQPCKRLLKGECPCKPYARLSVILGSAPTFGGLHVFRTTAWGSVGPIQTQLRMYREQFGSLWGLPLRLKLYPATVKFGANKEKKATAYWVAILLRASHEESAKRALEVHRTSELARREALRLLPGTVAALHEADREEAPHIAGEFFSETGPTSLGKLAGINQSIETSSAEVQEAEVVEIAGTLVQELEGILEAIGAQLSSDAVEKLRGAAARRDEPAMRTGIEWLERKAAAQDEALLKVRRVQARVRELLGAEDEQALDDALAAGDGATIRMWTQLLEERMSAPPKSAGDQQTSLL